MDRSVGDALHIRCRRRCILTDKSAVARSMSSTAVDPLQSGIFSTFPRIDCGTVVRRSSTSGGCNLNFNTVHMGYMICYSAILPHPMRWVGSIYHRHKHRRTSSNPQHLL